MHSSIVFGGGAGPSFDARGVVVCNVVVGGEDKLGAAFRALRWAFDLEVERVVLDAFVLELPATALTVTSAPVARHLEVGRVTMLKTQHLVECKNPIIVTNVDEKAFIEGQVYSTSKPSFVMADGANNFYTGDKDG